MKQFLLMAAFTVLLGTVSGITAGKPTATSALHPIYIPAPRSDVDPVCGGSTLLLSFDYWPVQGETWYEARFVANGGSEGGAVSLAIGDAYEEGVSLPADGMNHPYQIDVNIGQPGGEGPLPIFLYASVGPCGATDTSPARVRSLNVFAGSP